jgi:hypothetical protein
MRIGLILGVRKHLVFGNLDTGLLGTHHGVSAKHLQNYLNEFVFRINRCLWPVAAFDSVLKIASHVKAPTNMKFFGDNGGIAKKYC